MQTSLGCTSLSDKIQQIIASRSAGGGDVRHHLPTQPFFSLNPLIHDTITTDESQETHIAHNGAQELHQLNPLDHNQSNFVIQSLIGDDHHHDNPITVLVGEDRGESEEEILMGHLRNVDLEAGGKNESDQMTNRWPREETLALLRIRSELESKTHVPGFKGHVWEHVSRKMAELGYKRSGKKCKEKFENVTKYYKKTKDTRQEGKNYRFYSELECLYNNNTSKIPVTHPTTTTNNIINDDDNKMFVLVPSSSSDHHNQLLIRRSCNNDQLEYNLDDDQAASEDETLENPLIFEDQTTSTGNYNMEINNNTSCRNKIRPAIKKKRRRRCRSSFDDMKGLCEEMVNQMILQQEEIQRKFLEAMERRDKERVEREEAWKMKEMTRMSRENEVRAQERALASTRDSTIIKFLKKLMSSQPPAAPDHQNPKDLTTSSSVDQQKNMEELDHLQINPSIISRSCNNNPITHHPLNPIPVLPCTDSNRSAAADSMIMSLVGSVERSRGGTHELIMKRWPRSEVYVLIKLRCKHEEKFRENNSKGGSLWEKISKEMIELGYNRSAKRCKEKWENINKYFRKTKDAVKDRPADSKTCPYFRQLSSLYQNGVLSFPSSGLKQLDTPENRSRDHNELQPQDDHEVNINGIDVGEPEDQVSLAVNPEANIDDDHLSCRYGGDDDQHMVSVVGHGADSSDSMETQSAFMEFISKLSSNS